ncbi:hypothetical protein LCGC14_2718250, partial [marine sediment metagenome]
MEIIPIAIVTLIVGFVLGLISAC